MDRAEWKRSMRAWGGALLACLSAAGCRDGARAPALPIGPDADVADVRTLPQDCTAWLEPAAANRPLLDAAAQARRYAAFREAWLAPWREPRPDSAAALRAARAALRRFADDPGFGENLRPHRPQWIRRLADLADLKSFSAAAGTRAVTVRNTNLRALPTMRPHFHDPALAGEGYPFDNLQETALWAGTPALVHHRSADGAWVLAETPLGIGWAPAADVPGVDDALVRAWRSSPWAAVVKDRTVLREPAGRARFATHIGAVFPLAGRAKGKLELLAAVDAGGGRAGVARCEVDEDAAATMPLPITPAAVAAVGNRILGQPYGWGGLYGNRDCSATTRDLMVPFGLFLPRNSGDQARCGRYVDLGGAEGRRLEELVVARARPWITLLWTPGHVMLYVGSRDGRPAVLHSPWGVPVRRDGRAGRHVIGRCVITTLSPGAELGDYDAAAARAHRVRALVRLDEPPAGG